MHSLAKATKAATGAVYFQEVQVSVFGTLFAIKQLVPVSLSLSYVVVYGLSK